DTQTRSYCSLGVIFMGLRIAKIDQETVAKELSDVPIIASNHLRTGGLVGTDHFPVLFGVELGGKFCGVHEITEHDRELTAFRFRCAWFERWCNLRGLIVLDRRLLGWLSRERGDFLSASSVARPDETPPFVVSHWMHVEKFGFEGFEILVIQAE